jgi:nucleoside-diphosphate-sugar epimerase
VLNYKGAFSYVDVRDYAKANVRGLQRAEAGGERIIIAAGTFVPAHTFPSLPPPG